MYEYENLSRAIYDFGDDVGEAVFVLVCPDCGRFVKADNPLKASINGIGKESNADCTKCGRVSMPFEGFF